MQSSEKTWAERVTAARSQFEKGYSQTAGTVSQQPQKKEDTHPLAINVLKLQRYNFDFFNCEEVVFFEYLLVKAVSFHDPKGFYHSATTIAKETGIKRHSLSTIIKRFEVLGLIKVELRGMPKVRHFILQRARLMGLLPQIYRDLTAEGHGYTEDWEVLRKNFEKFLKPLNPKRRIPNPHNPYNRRSV